MIVYDAHAHAGSREELALRAALGVRTALSCGNPEQARTGEALLKECPNFILTAGVHPWYAETVSLRDMLPFMERAALVGEIGLDSVWCDTPMDAQRRAFAAQLDWAAQSGKGVVLHTKGCEMEIARAVSGFAHPVIVHWYSGGANALDRFLSQNCYFTIGPDVCVNPCVQAAARLVPDDRILFETDGMDAARWALGDLPTEKLPDVLLYSAAFAAQLRGQCTETLIQTANGNFLRLFGR